MRDVAALAWRVALLGALVVVAGFAAIVAASLQGRALVPGGSIVDGYWVGLLPWIDVGSWLIPVGGVVATVLGVASIWLGRAQVVIRIATIPVILVVLFWILVTAHEMAPHSAIPDVAPSPSSLAAVVYSSPINTILFLLIPAAVVLLLAAVARRRAT